jgi:hypothetical protein
VVVEIGSFAGESARLWLARAGLVICVDPWTPYVEHNDFSLGGIANPYAAEQEFDCFAAEFPERICKMKMSSGCASLILTNGFMDVVYVDGNHEEASVRADICLWLPKLSVGGLFCCHDYGHQQFGGVKRAFDGLLGRPEKVYEDTTAVIHRAERLPAGVCAWPFIKRAG